MVTAFTAGLLLITISELGDKTFCIAMLLAMRHSRRLVFVGVVAALAAMTVLSVLMGQVASQLPTALVHHLAVALFLGCGLKLLYDATRMSPHCKCGNEMDEAAETVDQVDVAPTNKFWLNYGVILQSFGLTFAAEWGDRTQFATVTLAASNNPWGVTAGAIVGHTICAAIAVLGGFLIAGRISERTITAIGGALFIIFGVVAAIEGV